MSSKPDSEKRNLVLQEIAPLLQRGMSCADVIETLQSIWTEGRLDLIDVKMGLDTAADQSRRANSCPPFENFRQESIEPGYDQSGEVGLEDKSTSTKRCNPPPKETSGPTIAEGKVVGDLAEAKFLPPIMAEKTKLACYSTPPANGCFGVLPSEDAFEPACQSSFSFENPQAAQKQGNIPRKRKRTYHRNRDDTKNNKQNNNYKVTDEYQGWHGDNEGNNSFVSNELAAPDSSAKDNTTTPEDKTRRHQRDPDGAEKHHTSSTTAEKHRKRRNRHASKKNQALNCQSNGSGAIKLPFGITHQLMDMLQKALEQTCYDWTLASDPSALAQNGLTHHKHGEMQHGLWCRVVKAKSLLPEQKDVYLDPSQDLDDLFTNAHTIRHSAVHRERSVSIAVMMVRINKAIELLTALKDFERAGYVKRLLQSVERFQEYVSRKGEFQELPVADEEFRKGQLREFTGYFDLVVGFLRRENELPTEYLMLDV